MLYTHGKKSSISSLYVMLKSYAGDLSVSIDEQYMYGAAARVYLAMAYRFMVYKEIVLQ